MKVVPATTLESLTEDAGTAREFEEDPLNYVGKARARFGNEILKAMKGLEKASQRGTFGWDIEKCVRGARGEGRGDVRGIYRKVVLALVEIHPKQTVREADAH